MPLDDNKALSSSVLDLPTRAARDNLSKPLVDSLRDAFFSATKSIDGARWSQAFPYQLLMVEKVGDSPALGVKARSSYTVWKSFTLPVPPQETTLQMPFAITNSITYGGVAEEHGGAPVRMVTLSGTTGVYPLRPRNPQAVNGPVIFGGTIAAAAATATAFRTAVNPGTPSASLSVTPPSNEALYASGYYQFRLMQQFLEEYAAIKKTADGAGLRLAFANWKDESVYLITPLTFNVKRTNSSPLEYLYDFQAKGYARIELGVPSAADQYVGGVKQPGTLAQILNRIRSAYSVISNAINTVRAIRADLQAVMNVVRQTVLALKQVVDFFIALADLPSQIIKDFKNIVIGSIADFGDAVTELRKKIPGISDSILTELGVKSKVRNHSPSKTNRPVGASSRSVLDDVFSNPVRYVDVLDKIELDQLTGIDAALQERIDLEIQRVSAFTPKDYAKMRDSVVGAMVAVSNAIGAGDATFDGVYGNVEPNANRIPNVDDFNILYALNDVVDGLNILALPDTDTSNPTLDFFSNQASDAGVKFISPNSKFTVPFPYGSTLEQLAVVYLGDPDRWIEIAAINNLREPYVDEIGFDLALLANGKLGQIVISSATNLAIGQPVWIQSNFIPREKRHILNIRVIGPGNVVLTLDGEPDLNKYLLADQAYIHAFLPDTVNSQSVVFIPSPNQGGNQQDLARVPGVDPFDPFLEVGGVDLLLTQNSDLVITPDGDGRMAYGVNNLIQWARVALSTPQGSLLRHPDFGLPIKPGISVADLDSKSLLDAAVGLFKNDPSFNGVVDASISIKGPVADIGLGLMVIGQRQPLNLAVRILR